MKILKYIWIIGGGIVIFIFLNFISIYLYNEIAKVRDSSDSCPTNKPWLYKDKCYKDIRDIFDEYPDILNQYPK